MCEPASPVAPVTNNRLCRSAMAWTSPTLRTPRARPTTRPTSRACRSGAPTATGETRAFDAHTAGVTCVAVLADGKRIVYASLPATKKWLADNKWQTAKPFAI